MLIDLFGMEIEGEKTVLVIGMIRVEIANSILDKYKHDNRPVGISHVTFLVKEMLAGYWKDNGQGLIFTESGRLIDGQHKLVALIKAAETDPLITLQLNFLLGIGDDVFETID